MFVYIHRSLVGLDDSNKVHKCGDAGLVLAASLRIEMSQVQFPPGPSDFSGHGTNPTCVSPHPGVEWVPVRVKR